MSVAIETLEKERDVVVKELTDAERRVNETQETLFKRTQLVKDWQGKLQNLDEAIEQLGGGKADYDS